ncbi:MAG: hypothetical protein QG657_3513, partial [Acidobacteriota bacterium]|nr:hypothetical protein [Acidobacteriota bacterium]
LTAVEIKGELEFTFEYCTKLFKHETMGRFIIYYKNIVSIITQDKGKRLSDLEMLPGEERKRLLYEFNDTAADYPKDKTVHRLFEEQASRTPDSVGLVGPVGLTYRQLNEQSDRLAGLLIEKGVLPDTIVGIMMERSVEMIIGIIGILKSGGAYLPIDPDYPHERIDYMLKDSATKLLVNEKFFRGFRAPRRGEPIKVLQKSPPLSLNLAYIIYTSGTTGRPKGSLIEHRNVVRLLFNDKFQFDFTARDVWTLFHSFCFDFSVWEIYGALLYGGKLHIVSKMKARDTAEFLGLLNRETVTVLNQTPSAFYNLLNEALTGREKKLYLKYVIFGGEALNPLKLKDFAVQYPQTMLINMFGITETTVHVTYKEITGKDMQLSIGNIGKPIPTLSLYILNRYLEPVPPGVTGELCIGGKGVCRGYLNRVELTKVKFIENPYKKGEPLYRSGDVGRFLVNGDIDYLGRIDHQVKIRGFRIELGEIEHRLLKYPGIKEAVVLAQEEEDKYLCAYIVSIDENVIPGLREYLSKELPDYMIPSYFVPLEKIPLTPNGKINRKALPKPGLKASAGYMAPRDEIETKLVDLWAEVLDSQVHASIGIDDDFFQLGGHSLKATILASKIHKEFEVRVPLVEIFKAPTIKELAKYIKEKNKELHISMEPAEEKEYYDLSPAQKRLYILQQLVSNNTSYNVPLVMPLAESVEKEKLEAVIKKLIERHESLRTSFITVNEIPVQRIYREVDFSIETYEVTGTADANSLISRFTKPFNLDEAPLLRVVLATSTSTPNVDSSRRFLFIDMHHIITDGTSQGILDKEFHALLKEESLSPLRFRLQYKDYAEWYNRLLRQGFISRQESYWLKEFPDELPLLDIPTDYPRPTVQSIEGNTVSFNFDIRETALLKAIAKQEEMTPYMALMAIFNILLAKLSGQEDIIIGTPIAARRHADLQNVIGMIVNTLSMRNFPSGDKVLKNFLQEVRLRTLEAYENQEYPFEVLVDKITIARDAGRNPVFDVMFNLLNQADYQVDVFEKHEQGPYVHIIGTSKFDMNLTAIEMGERFYFTLEYSTHLFKPGRIERIIGYYKNILQVLSHDTELKIAQIEIMDAKEKEEVLRLSNGVEEFYEGLETIHGWFAEQVSRTPDHISLVGAGSQTCPVTLTYNELNNQSDRLAGLLIEKGVLPDTVVGIMLERSVEMIIGILGIMKAGGAYLPIDSEYPRERIDYMLKDSSSKLLVNEKFFRGSRAPRRGEPIKVLQKSPICSANLVYVIYTSGSTGKPKGVMVEHRNLVNLLKFQFKYTNIDCSRILQFSTISFDASFHEIFSAFLSGGTLFLVKKETRADIPGLFMLIEKNGIKTVFLPISFLKVIFKEKEYIKLIPRCISHIQTAGEQVIISTNFKNYLKERQVYLHNHYGPSETHVVTTLTIDPKRDIAELPSIGKPLMNTGIYIVDKWGQLVPPGAAGEILIGGVQVGRGYLNRPELTREAFGPQITLITQINRIKKTKINKSFAGVKGELFQKLPLVTYKTGDLGRYLVDGNIEFLGRIDHQVKIRGFRIELEEIEKHLLKCDGIKEAVVLARTEDSGDKYLCAYIVASDEKIIPGLREYLSKELPDYMIPSYFVPLEKIPLTPNRKIDRKSLPKPELKASDSYLAPRDEIEKKLVNLWSEVLDSQAQASIGIDDNFFQLGGHSLKATVLISKIHKEFNVRVPLVEIFRAPVIRELAKYIRENNKEFHLSIEPTEKREYYALSSAQKRLYFLQQLDLSSISYNMPLVLPIGKEIKRDKLEFALTQLIARHESLRTSFHRLNNEVVQGVHESVAFEIEYLTGVLGGPGTLSQKGSWPPEAIIKNFIRPFDLSQAPLIRSGLIEMPDGKYIWLVDNHHIISDGTSQTVLTEDFMRLYETGEPLEPLPLQYKDFTQWQNQLFAGGGIKS